MRFAAMSLGVATTAALDLILLVGASGEQPSWFGVLVLVMDVALAASSVALGVVFLRDRMRTLGWLFLGNLGVMLAALLLRASGVRFPPAVLFGADLYWLNLYIVGLVVCIRGHRPRAEPGAAPDRGRSAGPGR